jgi:hypothetical protein
MVGFVGGSSLTYFLRGSGGMHSAIAYYGETRKITRQDLNMARHELEMLQALRADSVLRAQDLRGILLSELLFLQSRGSADLMNYVRQMIRRNQYRVSDRQLDALYERTGVAPAFYWILLQAEARSGGMRIRTEDVGSSLARVIPQLFSGQSYAAVMRSVVARYGVSEERILETFGRLLAVLQYAQTICATGSVTNAQIRHMASRENDTLDVELVQIRSADFADKEQKPTPEEMRAQFDRYKAYAAGEATESNPYGFGYKLPQRVRLDYIAVKLANVSSIVKPPTDEEAEKYYKDNRNRLFTEQIQIDPNDPNSVQERPKSYVDVVDTIRDQLKQQKITTKAEQILEEARNLADAELAAGTEEGQGPTVAQLKERAGDYQQIALDLASKYGITLHSGQTGWLSPLNAQTDEYLGRLFVTGAGPNPVRLSQLLFSVEALGEKATIVMSARRAELYRTIGPAREAMAGMGPDLSGQIMVIVRIIQAQKAAEPESLDVTFDTRALELGETSEKQDDSTYSVSEKVTEDLGKLAAWERTRDRADEFVALASNDGWDRAVARFNELYGEKAEAGPDEPNVFELQQLTGLRRISRAQLQVMATQVANNAAAEVILNEAKVERQFIDHLYSLVPADANAPPAMPKVVEFKPTQSFYCLSKISVSRLNQQEYQQVKGMLLRREEHTQTQSLAAVHFSPAHIRKRMKLRPAQETRQPSEAQAEPEPEGAT